MPVPENAVSNDGTQDFQLVLSENGKPVTNSLLVAQKFGKQHKNVLTSIREIMTTAENPAVLLMFTESTYYNDQSKQQPMYIIDRDGFSLLVMGFTGKDAMAFKIDFINAFNQMEKSMKSIEKALTPLDVMEIGLKQLREQEKRMAAVENEVKMIKASTQTRPDLFTVAGFLTIKGVRASMAVCAQMGKRAVRLCRERQIKLDEYPDPRFGKVYLYPTDILEEVYQSN